MIYLLTADVIVDVAVMAQVHSLHRETAAAATSSGFYFSSQYLATDVTMAAVHAEEA